MAEKRLETAKKYIGHFDTLDMQLLESLLTEDHLHTFAPASLNMGEPYTKQAFLKHHEHLLNILTNFPVTAKEYIDSESSRQVTVWATGQPFFRDDVKDDGIPESDWLYHGEYIFLLTMDETGEKITRTIEFLDSKATDSKLRPLMKRANENRNRNLKAAGK